MKKISLITGIYSIVASVILMIAPIITFYLVFSYQFMVQTSSGMTSYVGLITDIIFRLIALIMIILGFILVFKSKETSLAGQILIILAGFIVVLLSSILGFVSGILGIIGGILILASTRKIVVTETRIENDNIN